MENIGASLVRRLNTYSQTTGDEAMKNLSQKNSLSSELEAVFDECRESISEAVREYQDDICSAIQQLRNELDDETGTAH
ncbi:MAG TPA: hypothetical protein VI895_03875 [Bdellovibrionota bacterium]|nr:hypothetical protein [Bdellovibrionota bacterium]